MDVLKNSGVVKQIHVASPKDRTLIEESALLHTLLAALTAVDMHSWRVLHFMEVCAEWRRQLTVNQ